MSSRREADWEEWIESVRSGGAVSLTPCGLNNGPTRSGPFFCHFYRFLIFSSFLWVIIETSFRSSGLEVKDIHCTHGHRVAQAKKEILYFQICYFLVMTKHLSSLLKCHLYAPVLLELIFPKTTKRLYLLFACVEFLLCLALHGKKGAFFRIPYIMCCNAFMIFVDFWRASIFVWLGVNQVQFLFVPNRPETMYFWNLFATCQLWYHNPRRGKKPKNVDYASLLSYFWHLSQDCLAVTS